MSLPFNHQEGARSDEALVLRCQLGDRPAFSLLLERWIDPLHRHMRRLCTSRTEAEDLTQEVWMRVLRGIVLLRDAGRFRPWLFGIAHRVLADRFGSATSASWAGGSADSGSLERVADSTADPLSAARIAEADIARGLLQLPLVEREVLTLHHLDGWPLAEIAQIVGIPLGTVKSRLFRARQTLRHALAVATE